ALLQTAPLLVVVSELGEHLGGLRAHLCGDGTADVVDAVVARLFGGDGAPLCRLSLRPARDPLNVAAGHLRPPGLVALVLNEALRRIRRDSDVEQVAGLVIQPVQGGAVGAGHEGLTLPSRMRATYSRVHPVASTTSLSRPRGVGSGKSRGIRARMRSRSSSFLRSRSLIRRAMARTSSSCSW